MVNQTSETPNITSLQAGPVEVDDGTPSYVTTRDTQAIGQQLAQIGDELNRRWAQRLSNRWLLQPLVGRTNIFIRAQVYRCFFVTERGVRNVFGLGKLWLNPLVYTQPAWITSLSPAGLRWTRCLLVATALLATAAVYIALRDNSMD